MAAWIAAWLLLGAMAPRYAVAAPAQARVEAVYSQSCATCHGTGMEGGSGGSLADGVWKHGSSDAEIAAAVSGGIADAGMPAFAESLSPETIRSLVVYIREKEAAFRQGRPPASPSLPTGPVKTQRATFLVEPVVSSGLETPWALAFLPDGRKLVTEKKGRLRVVDGNWNLLHEPVAGTPEVVVSNQGGLLDAAPAPDFAESGWVYLSYSAPAPGGGGSSMTKISRGRIVDNGWAGGEAVFEAGPGDHTASGVHFGSRIIFSGGFLYFSIGDRGAQSKAQDTGLPYGKVFRIFPDGKIPGDNPFAGRRGALAAVWSYGHRNPQGLAADPRDNSIYATEHGPRGGDEFNRILKGANYGWPLVCFGMNYNGTPISARTGQEGIEPPLHHWTPSIGACGLAFYGGAEFPGWEGDFFAGGLRGSLHRLRVEGGRTAEHEVVLAGCGRVRDVRSGPDGLLYLVLNNPDSIVRLVPATAENGGGK